MKLWERILDWFDPGPPPPPKEVVMVNWSDADRMLKANDGWRLSPMEDDNQIFGMVWLERDTVQNAEQTRQPS